MEHIDKHTFKQIFRDHWEDFKAAWPRYDTNYYDTVVQKMLDCGDPEKMGFVQPMHLLRRDATYRLHLQVMLLPLLRKALHRPMGGIHRSAIAARHHLSPHHPDRPNVPPKMVLPRPHSPFSLHAGRAHLSVRRLQDLRRYRS